MDDTEAALALSHEEVRVRELLVSLETGGIIGHTGLTEQLLPVEDRSPGGGATASTPLLE